jgi:hypothetical protein
VFYGDNIDVLRRGIGDDRRALGWGNGQDGNRLSRH